MDHLQSDGREAVTETASGPGGPPTGAAIASLLESALIAQAQPLARTGRLEEAAALLAPATAPPAGNVAALDLLAKIRAQQGRLAEASLLWERALALEPDNETFRSALQRCSSPRHFSRTAESLKALLVPILLLAFVAISVESALQTRRDLRLLRSEISQLPPASAPSPAPELGLDPEPDLTEPVARVLRDNPLLAPLDLTVEQAGAVLRVVGEVPDIGVRYAAEDAVRAVPGVGVVDLGALTLPRTYTVRPGDSLWRIATRLYGGPEGWTTLAEINHLSLPYTLRTGQSLALVTPATATHEDAGP